MSDRNTTGTEEFFEPYQAPVHPAVAALLPASVQHATALHNHRVAGHAQKVIKDTQSRLRGTSLIDIIDGVGRQIRVIGIPGGTGALSAFQWQVTINGDNKAAIAPGSLVYKALDKHETQTVANYDAEAGWSHSSAVADKDMVVLALTLNSSAVITAANLAVIAPDEGTGEYELYTTTGSPVYLNTMRIPIAIIEVTGSGANTVRSVKAQFISAPMRLHPARWGNYFGYTTL